jgi:Nitrile hydratase beta subunit
MNYGAGRSVATGHAPYYDKWLYAIVSGMLEKGVVSDAELTAELRR